VSDYDKQPVLMGYCGKWAQQQSLYPTEDSGIGPDP